MTDDGLSAEFAAAFRTRLIDHVAQAARCRPPRTVVWGAGIALTVVLGGTVAAAATGLLILPGTSEVTPIAVAETIGHAGTGSLDLGPVPAEATGAALSFTCLTPGTFSFNDGASVTCTAMDDTRTSTSSYVLPLESMTDGQVRITTTPDARWALTAGYVTAETTSWGVNDAGQTYGVINPQGEPDLIAVIATNNRPGYVLRTDLADANGTTASHDFTSPEDALRWQEENAAVVHLIPVYEQDGTTLIGQFRVGGG